MNHEQFKKVVMTLSPYITDTYNLLNAADAVMGVLPVTMQVDTHEGRVLAALADPEVIQHMRDGKRINAIKRIRVITNCGLLDAKNASEDPRLMAFHPSW